MNSAFVSADQQAFIDENLDKMTVPQLADSTGLLKRHVHMYLQKKNKKALPTRNRQKRHPLSYEKNGMFDVVAYSQYII